MLVLRTSSKRQRRPNVRLGEIGDASVAFSYKARVNLEEKKWKNEPKETVLILNDGFSGQMSPGLLVSDPNVSQKSSADALHNRENRNPNSSKLSSELVVLGEADAASKPAVDFGIVKRKGRLMKRRGRSMIAGTGISSKAWNCKVASEVNNENGKGHRSSDFVGPTSNASHDVDNVSGFKDSSGRETSDTSKGDHQNECFEPFSAVQVCGDQDEFWKGEASIVGDTLYSDDGPCVNPKSGAEYDKMEVGGIVVNCVRTWLEELGFGQYAGIFEVHEVDEEALPLLTFEDLKEMGINTVGPRRKMYTAIQHLREQGGFSV
ncbi:uncharacterized protein LOC122078641 [Macadamia integrifolia]|uniref:uncharacterized protein LOC122078641 n=1 Tax=Macadamia integrifolia TaxID=60698 RepID=UPI001C4F6B37|nr:uncharacterized protein LOC122078641 [Macadamia integrifolia]